MKKINLSILLAVAFIFMAFTYYTDTPVQTKTSNGKMIPLDNQGIVVLELFTSQGCSSCPSADEKLKKVKLMYPKQVFALSYHVDYWNYIGWEDPFSNPAYTLKQRAYNIQFKNRSNYTPQLVVNGNEHFVGSDGIKLASKIKAYSALNTPNKIKLAGNRKSNSVAFDFEVLGNLEGRKLRAVLVLNERTTEIKRGENRNRVLENANIVVAEKYLDIFKNKGSNAIDIPSLVNDTDALTLMIIAEGAELKITGAAKISI